MCPITQRADKYINNSSHHAHILVVDDEPTNLKLIDRILRSAGYDNLTLLNNPLEVIPLYLHNKPDLILLDINMPTLNGYEVMAQLQGLRDELPSPVIMLTAQVSDQHLLQAFANGARDYVTKPFNRNELLARVRNLLEAHLAHKLVCDQNLMLSALVKERTEAISHTRLQVVQRLGKAAEYRDEETGNHILRMSNICVLLASAIGWNDGQCELMLNASPMHDIGKIGIPDKILLKPGKLDAQEWRVMQSHTVIGAKLLDGDDSDLLLMAKDIALTHHEKWNGSGYPNGLYGEDIPLSGRIAALADVFDALVSRRPYKQPWPFEEAVQFIKTNSGVHFDPELVEVFLKHLEQVRSIQNQYGDQAVSLHA
ncbi:HD domain-containing phosphohydrolase [Halioxenophilus sp. WMMB6]|uniref:HD domain-containing phosphohydrolase n=1 Tax=Halioxenophilus sp. WMMB6 TaxID=3073815 RepID=UPI00295F57E9|nr:HD domain-containing phosphohydrolase [Halioxenophilus sp. WMMB6]